jgi:hypothetical protein
MPLPLWCHCEVWLGMKSYFFDLLLGVLYLSFGLGYLLMCCLVPYDIFLSKQWTNLVNCLFVTATVWLNVAQVWDGFCEFAIYLLHLSFPTCGCSTVNLSYFFFLNYCTYLLTAPIFPYLWLLYCEFAIYLLSKLLKQGLRQWHMQWCKPLSWGSGDDDQMPSPRYL